MNEDAMRWALGMLAFSLPSMILMFMVAWFMTMILPKPRPSWKIAIAAFPLAWIASVLASGFAGIIPLQSSWLGLLYAIQIVVSLMVLIFLARFRSRVTE